MTERNSEAHHRGFAFQFFYEFQVLRQQKFSPLTPEPEFVVPFRDSTGALI